MQVLCPLERCSRGHPPWVRPTEDTPPPGYKYAGVREPARPLLRLTRRQPPGRASEQSPPCGGPPNDALILRRTPLLTTPHSNPAPAPSPPGGGATAARGGNPSCYTSARHPPFYPVSYPDSRRRGYASVPVRPTCPLRTVKEPAGARRALTPCALPPSLAKRAG